MDASQANSPRAQPRSDLSLPRRTAFCLKKTRSRSRQTRRSHALKILPVASGFLFVRRAKVARFKRMIRTLKPSGRKLRILPLIAATYFMVSGGPYGIEDIL